MTKKATTPQNLEHMPVQDVIIAHRYENMIAYISLATFLAMGTIFFLILSL